MQYTLETLRQMAEQLRAIPAKDPSQRRLHKQAAVRELAQEIIALRQRGYTIEEVTDSLRGIGFEIATPTLRNYLQRAKKSDAKRQRPPRPKGHTQARTKVGAPATPKPPPARAPRESDWKTAAAKATAEPPSALPHEQSLRSGKGAFLIKDKESY